MKKLRCLASLIILSRALCAAGADSASAPGPTALETVGSDGMKFLKGAGYIVSAPARWKGNDWLKFGGAGVATVASTGLDIDGRQFMQNRQTPGNDRLASAAAQYGAWVPIALSAGGYVTGLAFDERWLRETSFLAGSAILIAGTITTVTKVVVGRARPYTGAGHMAFRPFSINDDYASFPSGHTTVAFAFSGVLAARLDNVWASIGLYGLATATGLSRMYTDEHWFSDVVFGAILSVSVSRSLVRWFESGEDSSGGSGLRILPGAGSFTLVWTF
ncbi:MAG TPA: phosphatase PAP2 family protein [Bacteroidota bacterium]|nr:phosphatase PAP2 family protein [Bacteroidota bacterium]